MKIKLTQNQINFLERGTTFVGPNGVKWYYMPFWFKETEEARVFDKFSLDELPEDFKKALQDHRDGKGYYWAGDFSKMRFVK